MDSRFRGNDSLTPVVPLPFLPLHVPLGSTIIMPDDPASSDPILRGLTPVQSLLLSVEAVAGVLPEGQ